MKTTPWLPLIMLLVLSPVHAQDWNVDTGIGETRELAFTTTEGTWMNLDISPDGLEIVFDLLGDIYLLPVEGGRARLLRGGVPFESQPQFSPDGTRISFTSDASGGDNIWVMDRDGSNPRPVTSETYRLLNNAVWTPDGRFLIARKHFTSGRSLGAGEMWMYHVERGGSGVQLTEKRTPQKDTGEPAISRDGEWLYYSDDTTPGDTFEYNKDPHGGIYAIKRRNLVTGKTETVISGPGGAVRPELSPDGKTLAFVRRIRFKTVLCLLDLESGSLRTLYEDLSRDQQETWAIFGVHPNFTFTTTGDALVTWARGGLWRIDVATGEARAIPFEADVKMALGKTARSPERLGLGGFPVRVIRYPTVAPNRSELAFTALGRTFRKELPGGEPTPVTRGPRREHQPAYSPDGTELVHAVWTDQDGGFLEVITLATGEARRVTDTPGHYVEPSFSPDGRSIVYRKTSGDTVRGRAFGKNPGIYRVAAAGGNPELVTDDGRWPRYQSEGDRLLLLRGGGAGVRLVSVDEGGHDEREIATSKDAVEILLSPDGRYVAWTELFHTYVTTRPPSGRSLVLNKTNGGVPSIKLSKDAGEFLQWSPDSTTLFFSHAHRLMSARVPPLLEWEVEGDAPDGRAEETEELSFLHIDPKFDSDLVLVGATIVTLEGDQVIDDGVVHVRGTRIVAVGKRGEVTIPDGAIVEDMTGMTITPGFVDVHAHMSRGSDGLIPQQSWPLLATLAFGFTTIHDPSADTHTVFAESELQKAGLLLGPRITSTGTILYGAEGNFRAEINSIDDARSHLRRLKEFGAFSVKSYNQPRREQRQQILAAARELDMKVVPEGGSTFFHNLTHIIDGHTTLEHALPVGELYNDVVTLFAESGTAYTPTLIVGYGGIWGENYWYHTTDVFKNERLLRWVPRPIVDARSIRRTMAPELDYHHITLARNAAKIVRAGGLAEIGAHGQLQGLGGHWEMWMFAQGGLTNLEVLRVATMNGARALGLDQDIGSLAPGKLADMVFYKSGDSPLVNIRNSEKIAFVMQGGRLFDATTLDQVLPVAIKRPLGPKLELLNGGSLTTSSCPCTHH